jgi:hypothetical protein
MLYDETTANDKQEYTVLTDVGNVGAAIVEDTLVPEREDAGHTH